MGGGGGGALQKKKILYRLDIGRFNINENG